MEKGNFRESSEFKAWCESEKDLRKKTLSSIRRMLEMNGGEKVELSVAQDGVKAVQCSKEFHGKVRVFWDKTSSDAEEIPLGLLCKVATELYYTLGY